MTPRTYLFNPENDLALALGCRHYTPPPHAASLHRAGALLPAWWAEEDDSVIAPLATADEIAWLKDNYGINVNLEPNGEPEPWGWSLDAKRQFAIAGVPSENLPSDDNISRLRQLSHRRVSRLILSELGFERLPVEVTDPEEAVGLHRQYGGVFVKAPWSSSGRGVFSSAGISDQVVAQKVAGLIHRQGSVMIERQFDKISDLAALFYSDGQRVTYRGVSMFQTEPRGVYTGNICAPQEQLLSKLGDDQAEYEEFTNKLEPILSALICPYYRGWLGIDMMIYRDDSGSRLHPCIELNLRRTMGVVAMDITRRLDLRTPHLLAWHHGAPAPAGRLLLPPRDSFSLQLTVMK